MATKVLDQIDRDFLQCSICLDQFDDPRLLPCQHRFCLKCLKEYSASLQEGAQLHCPLCKVVVELPKGDLQALPKDFLIQSLSDLLNLDHGLRVMNRERQCSSCCEVKISVCFCGECGGFLCKNCYQLHKSLVIFKQHSKVILLEDVAEGKVSIDFRRLAQLRNAPKCETHESLVLDLKCTRCNVQICSSCGQVDHFGHKLENVKDVAKRVRQDLSRVMKSIEDLSKKVDIYKQDVERKKMQEGEKLDQNHMKKVKENKEELDAIHEKLKRCRYYARKDIYQVESNFQAEVKKLQALRDLKIENVTRRLKQEELQLAEEMRRLNEKTDQLNKEIKEVKLLLQQSTSKLEEEIQMLKRRRDTCLLSAEHAQNLTNDWSAVDIIPDLCESFRVLISDMQQFNSDLPKMDSKMLLSLPLICSQSKCFDLELRKLSSFNIVHHHQNRDGANLNELSIVGCDNGRLVAVVPIGAGGDFNVWMFALTPSPSLLKKSEVLCCNGFPTACHMNSYKLLIIVHGALDEYSSLLVFDVNRFSFKHHDLWFKAGEITTNPSKNHIIVENYITNVVHVLSDELHEILQIDVKMDIGYVSNISSDRNLILICGESGCIGVNYEGDTTVRFYPQNLPEPSSTIFMGGHVYIAWIHVGVGAGTEVIKYKPDGEMVRCLKLKGERITSVTHMRMQGKDRFALYSSTTKNILVFR